MNVLSLGARVIGLELAREVVEAFVKARFSGEERYVRRLTKVEAMQRGNVETPIAAPAAQGRALTTDG